MSGQADGVRKRTAAGKATDDVIISPEKIRESKERTRAWLQRERDELQRERDLVKKQNEKSSDTALKVVIAVWVLIVCGIFYHVFSTIMQGRRLAAARGESM